MGDDDKSIFDQADKLEDVFEGYNIPEYSWVWPSDANPYSDVILTSGGNEMIRISDNGFYVRGKKIKQDKDESKKVYKAFKEWLTYAILKGKDPEDE